MRPQWPALELEQQQVLLQAWRIFSSRQRAQDQSAAVSFQIQEKQSLKMPKQYFWMVCINELSLSWHWPRLCCFHRRRSNSFVHPCLCLLQGQLSPSAGLAVPPHTAASPNAGLIPGKASFQVSVCVGFVPFPSQPCNGFAARREVMMETESPCLLSHMGFDTSV